MFPNADPSKLRQAVADYWANMAKIVWRQSLKLIETQIDLLSRLKPIS